VREGGRRRENEKEGEFCSDPPAIS